MGGRHWNPPKQHMSCDSKKDPFQMDAAVKCKESTSVINNFYFIYFLKNPYRLIPVPKVKVKIKMGKIKVHARSLEHITLQVFTMHIRFLLPF